MKNIISSNSECINVNADEKDAESSRKYETCAIYWLQKIKTCLLNESACLGILGTDKQLS